LLTALAVAPFVLIFQTAAWIIGEHALPHGSTWVAAGLGVVVWVIALAVMLGPC
jgi:hypothetical protein